MMGRTNDGRTNDCRTNDCRTNESAPMVLVGKPNETLIHFTKLARKCSKTLYGYSQFH